MNKLNQVDYIYECFRKDFLKKNLKNLKNRYKNKDKK